MPETRSSDEAGGRPFGSASEAADSIASVCTAVPDEDWSGTSPAASGDASGGWGAFLGGATTSRTLYDRSAPRRSCGRRRGRR